MIRFRVGQRVLVRQCASGHVLGGIPGTVYRPRRADDAAWIDLDERAAVLGAHPFPEDDPFGRGRHVLAWPEDCEEET